MQATRSPDSMGSLVSLGDEPVSQGAEVSLFHRPASIMKPLSSSFNSPSESVYEIVIIWSVSSLTDFNALKKASSSLSIIV